MKTAAAAWLKHRLLRFPVKGALIGTLFRSYHLAFSDTDCIILKNFPTDHEN
jgi:hypothetical protein